MGNAIRNFVVKLICQDDDNMDKMDGKEENEYSSTTVRAQLGQYDDDWIRNRCSTEDREKFFKWWYFKWKRERPPLKVRIIYFYKYASTKEIFFASDVFQNILFGQKYDEELRGFKAFLGVVLSLIHMIIFVIFAFVAFCLGLVTWGYLWPKGI